MEIRYFLALISVELELDYLMANSPKTFTAYKASGLKDMLQRLYKSYKRAIIGAAAILMGLLVLAGISALFSFSSAGKLGFHGDKSLSVYDIGENARIKSTTWNIAAINNNPFEYWITNDDPAYNELMSHVSTRIMRPPSKEDVLVRDIFTESMLAELVTQMKQANFVGVDETAMRYRNDFSNRQIYSGFLTDSVLGKKRLISMADRTTNTVRLGNHGASYRPTVINCYAGDLGDLSTWWTAWQKFMFESKFSTFDPVTGQAAESKTMKDMLQPIKHSKYPAITVEEEKISIALQVLSTAIFDAILVDMMNKLNPSKWQLIRQDICMRLNKNKQSRTAEILEGSYAHSDVVFLQEVASSFSAYAKKRPLGDKLFDVLTPKNIDPSRDQNSFILLKKDTWWIQDEEAPTGQAAVSAENKELASGYTEVTEAVLGVMKALSPEPVPVSAGDFFVVKATHKITNTKYLLASFHGDTNGLATIPVLDALQTFALKVYPDHKLLFGLDANTYSVPDEDQQGVREFAKHYVTLKMDSCWGEDPDVENFTTYHARTHLQTQLNKAVSLEDMQNGLKGGDKNPKDFILFFEDDFLLLHTMKDNTGMHNYIENMVFPTLTFPSDHGITSTVLLDKPRAKAAEWNLRGQKKNRKATKIK